MWLGRWVPLYMCVLFLTFGHLYNNNKIGSSTFLKDNEGFLVMVNELGLWGSEPKYMCYRVDEQCY